MIKLTIEGKPLSVNQTYQKTAYAYYMTKKGKDYKDSAIEQAISQYKKDPLIEDLEVTLTYYFWSKRKLDHLNMNKWLLDALNEIIWVDDSQIKISHHYTEYDKERPRIELIVKKITSVST